MVQKNPWSLITGILAVVFLVLYLSRSSSSSSPQLAPHLGDYTVVLPEIHHKRWVVITSINPPTDAVKRLAALEDWHVVLVGDKKSPPNWNYPNCTYLSVELQKTLPYEIMKLLPYGHYGRKNVGYLFAIEHGAEVIYETDDDNELREGWDLKRAFLETVHPKNFLTYVNSNNKLSVNPYRYFGQPTTWPRGYPLSKIGDKDLETYARAADFPVGIQQGLANGDPDMDAIFRLTRKDIGKPIEFNFDEAEPVGLPRGLMSPFNSQNTLFQKSAFWGLMIPITTSFRVCDIWRGYWAQRLLWEVGQHLAFFPPSVAQIRNPHDYLKDFLDELALYEDSGRLVEFLINWKCSKTSFFECVSQLSRDMATEKFWEEGDAALTNAWLSDLKRIGYLEPSKRIVTLELSEPVSIELKWLPTSNLGDSIRGTSSSKHLRC